MALTKSKIKTIRSLGQKKFRQKYNKFTVEGDKITKEVLQQKTVDIDAIYALPNWLEINSSLIHVASEQVHTVSERELKTISQLNTPNAVLMVCNQLPVIDKFEMHTDNPFSLYLDGIQNPGNLGTIIRTADWFGVHQLFCSEDCVELYNPKVLQATMGSFARVRCIYQHFRNILEANPDVTIYGAVPDGSHLYQTDLSKGPGIVVIGNEGGGISSELLSLIDQKISIPRAKNSSTESLNAAIATGIILAEYQRCSLRRSH